MSVRAKTALILGALIGMNLAIFAAKLELHRAIEPVLKALGS